MNVKFIVTKDGRVVFGEKDYKKDGHSTIAFFQKIPDENVLCGGIADTESRRIWGTSTGYGDYNVQHMQRLLPDWRIDPPGRYD